MSKRWRILLAVLLFGTLLGASETRAKQPQPPTGPVSPAGAVPEGDSSVMFIENVGQFAQGARFQVWGGDRTIWLAEDAIWITLLERPHPQPLASTQGKRWEKGDGPGEWDEGPDGAAVPRRGVHLKLSFPDANPHPHLEHFNRLETHVSYFIGRDPAKWHPDVPVWGGVRYVDLYPGIDLEITGENGQTVQCLVARPGADLNVVRLRVEGTDALAIDGDHLRLSTAVGEFLLPLLRTMTADSPSLARAESVLAASGDEISTPFAGASPPGVDATAAMRTVGVSDLLYSTFLGGASEDRGYGVNVDGEGNAYVGGWTYSFDFPTTLGAFDTVHGGGPGDVFVIKLNADGTGLAYATFLGGSGDDSCVAIARDEVGNAYVTGKTTSFNFPTTAGSFDTSHNGNWDAYIVKLNSTGSTIVYGTFLGGTGEDCGNAITVDGTGSAYIVGFTRSSTFPTTEGAFDTDFNGGAYDAFVLRLNPDGSTLVYSTFLGGAQEEAATAIAVDTSETAYVTGWSSSSNFPSTIGAFDTTYNGLSDAVVVKVNSAGTGLTCATFLGGSGSDYGEGIAVDGAGNAFLTGYTFSSDFPTTVGAFDTSHNGNSDAFVVKLDFTGSALAYATFLGGNSDEQAFGLAVDTNGATYVTGWTWSSNFPTTPDAFDTTLNGRCDIFAVKLNGTGSALAYATVLGGSNEDYCTAIGVQYARVYLTGFTLSSDLPTTPGAFDTSFNGTKDVFVAKLAMGGGSGPDFTVTRIEITQAIQDEANSIPLVANKRTVVRVYARATGNITVPNVTGELRALQGGSPIKTITPEPATFEANPVTVPYADTQILNAQDALNFYIDGLAAGTYTFQATVGISPSVSGEGSISITREFTNTRPIRVLYCNVLQGISLPNAAELAGYYDEFLERVYPIPGAASTSHLYEYGGPILNDALCPAYFPPCRAVLDTHLLERLFWYNLFHALDPTAQADFIVGFVPDKGLDFPGSGRDVHGSSIPLIRSVVAEHDPTYAPSVLAHEIGHHNDLIGGHLDFDLGDEYEGGCFKCVINPPAPDVEGGGLFCEHSCPESTQAGNVNGTFIFGGQNKGAFDPYSGSAKWVPLYYSYMGNQDTANSWVTENVYRRLVGALTTGAGDGMLRQQALEPSPYIMLSGIISKNDTINLQPFYTYTDTITPEPPPTGPYSAEAQDASGTPLATQAFTVSFTVMGTAVEETDTAPFVFAMPYPAGTKKMVLKHDSTVLATVSVSANPPTVTVTSPAGGESWSGVHNVEWIASDPDSDPLTYTLLYSADGTNWLAFATNITGTAYALDTSMVAGGSACRIQVWASDGVNTAVATSNAFTVTRKVPNATITSPPNGAQLHVNDPVTLNGLGYDLEDGQLPDSALSWSRDEGQVLGTGSPLFIGTLPLGTHFITLTITDTDSMTDTAAVTVTVVNQSPTLGTVRPSSSSAKVGVTKYFTTTWNDADGYTDLKWCMFLVGTNTAQANSVYLCYNNSSNKVMIRSNDGSKWWGGKEVGSANVIQNAQASVDCSQTTVSKAGDTITVRWAIQFKSGYTGKKNLYLKARDMAGAVVGWAKKGSVTINP